MATPIIAGSETIATISVATSSESQRVTIREGYLFFSLI